MKIERDVPLAPLTTLGLGGPAKRLVRVTSVAELVEVLALDERMLVLGGGSNLVVADAGWDGLVVQPALSRIAHHGDDRVTVGAGVVWDDFVAQMVADGRGGIESMSGIPGWVGATPIQNVGAYGQEVADTVVGVRAYDRERRAFVKLRRDECGFGYRTSMFKGDPRWIVYEVTFRLPRAELSAPIRYPELTKALGAERAPLADVRRTVIDLRRGKGMVLDPADPESRSAGSFFTNPIVEPARVPDGAPQWPQPDGRVKISAAWLIERAGFAKGYTRGRVGISKKHALALVNRGGATSAELLALAREIQDGVRARLGIELVPEPVIV
jgi:UDP-N-acetylmuramate dehydrogenase